MQASYRGQSCAAMVRGPSHPVFRPIREIVARNREGPRGMHHDSAAPSHGKGAALCVDADSLAQDSVPQTASVMASVGVLDFSSGIRGELCVITLHDHGKGLVEGPFETT